MCKYAILVEYKYYYYGQKRCVGTVRSKRLADKVTTLLKMMPDVESVTVHKQKRAIPHYELLTYVLNVKSKEKIEAAFLMNI